MKLRIAIAGTLGLLAGAALVTGVLKAISPRPALVQVLPLRDSFQSYTEAEARSWHREFLRLSPSDEADSASYEAANLELYNGILELSLNRPQLLAEPDLSATVIRIVRSFAEAPELDFPADGLANLCLAIRWTPARLQPVAEECKGALSESAGKAKAPVVRSDTRSIVILNPTRSLSRAAQGYRENPYRPEPIAILATELARAGQFQSAWQLHEELVQLDLVGSAELMSELAELKGLKHRSEKLPY